MSIAGIVLVLLGIVGAIGALACQSGGGCRSAPRPRDDEGAAPSSDGGEAKEAFKIVLGVGLFCMTLIGVMSTIKGLGYGAYGKGIGMLGMVLACLLVWGVVSAIKHRGGVSVGKVAGSLAAVLLAASLLVTLFLRSASLDPQGPSAELAAEFREQWLQVTNELADARADAGAEIGQAIDRISDELHGVAPPTIDLGADDKTDAPQAPAEETEAETEAPAATETDGEPSANASGEAASDEPAPPLQPAGAPLPAWASDKPAANQHVVVSDPYPTVGGARVHAEELLGEWLGERIERRAPASLGARYPFQTVSEELRERIVRDEHVQRRDSSVGDVYLVRLLAEIDEEDEEDLVRLARDHAMRVRQETGFVTVAATGGGVLACLAALYGALSYGGEKRA